MSQHAWAYSVHGHQRAACLLSWALKPFQLVPEAQEAIAVCLSCHASAMCGPWLLPTVSHSGINTQATIHHAYSAIHSCLTFSCHTASTYHTSERSSPKLLNHMGWYHGMMMKCCTTTSTIMETAHMGRTRPSRAKAR